MRLCRSAARLTLCTLLVLLVAGQAAAQMGRVGGVVKNEDGQPIKGATVTIENSNIAQTFTATTDDRGRFSIIGLRSGTWRFFAQAPGFSTNGGDMAVRMGAPNPPITFVLTKTGVANYGPLGGITSKELQDGIQQADTLFDAQKWDEAIAGYRSLISRSPALAMLNLQVAAAHRGKKDFDAALAAYDALLRVDPDNGGAHVGVAETHLERGDRTTAEATLLKAAQSSGASREVLFTLADLRFSADDTTEAARWYQKAADADPFWGKPVYKLGLCALKTGDSEGAAKLMAKVVAIDPVSPEAALAKASLESLKK